MKNVYRTIMVVVKEFVYMIKKVVYPVKTSTIVGKRNASSNLLKKLKYQSLSYALDGDYQGYKATQRNLAKLTIKNPEILFSKTGLNILGVWFLNLFRRSVSAEKELKKSYYINDMT